MLVLTFFHDGGRKIRIMMGFGFRTLTPRNCEKFLILYNIYIYIYNGLLLLEVSYELRDVDGSIDTLVRNKNDGLDYIYC